ncbi:hypothetical protein L7F22_034767 [Adiantum nelumboides]|nr:hypothetical protein [Adiantum nelumboides]
MDSSLGSPTQQPKRPVSEDLSADPTCSQPSSSSFEVPLSSKRRKPCQHDSTGYNGNQFSAVAVAQRCPPHPGYIHGLCIKCGSLKLSDETAEESHVALRYIHTDFKISSHEAERIRSNELKKLLLRKKLYLVLDLDHTLLNSTTFYEVTPKEDALLRAAYGVDANTTLELHKDMDLHTLHNLQLYTKLRPFVHDFLEEASKLFELHVYTMGDRAYAQTVAQILDPLGHLFGTRVISKAESTCRTTKDLDILLSAESAVVILDDTKAVWPNHRHNLIVMERYHFFGSSCKQFWIANPSLLEAQKDESAEDGTLANTLNLLRQIHTAFFDGYYANERGTQSYEGKHDVRQILPAIRSRVLAGCRLLFSGIFSTTLTSPNTHPLWQLAERLGATCSTSVDANVTHVVALDRGTQKAIWAQEASRPLIHPRWIKAAYYIWKRPHEEDYPVPHTPDLTTYSKTVNKDRPNREIV